jgi:hypothetical protein
LAQMMIEADPEAAIRAFGLAMQDFGTEKAAGKTAA